LERVDMIVAGATDEFVVSIGLSDKASGAERGDYLVARAKRGERSVEVEGFFIFHTSRISRSVGHWLSN
jgi:hypothetical protein